MVKPADVQAKSIEDALVQEQAKLRAITELVQWGIPEDSRDAGIQLSTAAAHGLAWMLEDIFEQLEAIEESIPAEALFLEVRRK